MSEGFWIAGRVPAGERGLRFSTGGNVGNAFNYKLRKNKFHCTPLRSPNQPPTKRRGRKYLRALFPNMDATRKGHKQQVAHHSSDEWAQAPPFDGHPNY